MRWRLGLEGSSPASSNGTHGRLERDLPSASNAIGSASADT
jgi:hypothetical protein